MLKPSFKSDVQKAFNYAIYMIADSYWDKTSCNEPKDARRLRSNYTELSLVKQYEMEKLAILFMDKVAGCLPEKFFKAPVGVDFVERIDGKKGKYYKTVEVRFSNKYYTFCIVGKYNETKPVIRYKLTKR